MVIKKIYPKKSKKVLNPQKVSAMIRKQINKKLETKIFGESASEQSISSASAGTVFSTPSVVAQGNGMNQRIGSQIRPIGFLLDYILHNNSAVAGYARVLVVTSNHGDYTANTDTWLAGTDSGGQAPVAERLTDVFFRPNKKQFNKVLYDKTHRIAGLGDGTGVETVHRRKLIKFNALLDIEPGETDALMNNVRMLVLFRSADSDTTASVVEFTYETTMYYKDA